MSGASERGAAPAAGGGPPAPFDGVFAGRRVLVTGDTGFKGSWLCSWLLSLGAEVFGYALRPPTEPSLWELTGLAREVAHVAGDVRDLARLNDTVSAVAPEIVFHLAAQPLVRASYADPRLTLETNVLGVVNLLEAVRACPAVRVVLNVTTDKVYENHETTAGYAETDPLGGHDPYSASKACSELVSESYRRSFLEREGRVALATARAGNVLGGGDWGEDRLVPDCVRAVSLGRPVEVRHPEAVRPWQHVLEPLSGYLWLGARLWQAEAGGTQTGEPGRGDERPAAAALAGPWNFGPGDDALVAVADVVTLFLAAYGAGEWTVAEDDGEQPHEAGLLVLDCAKAREVLGWQAVWDLRSAVLRAAAWYRAWAAGADDLRTRLDRDIADFTHLAAGLRLPWALGSTAERPGAGGTT
ncbi:MAG TPA: CDP-glucose 4,6-dehydratase [Thermoleophilia bacterium]|nr:CDP-glucose 4,6-dehydratase [Thermoleophilia bacterium]